jgi:exosortase
MTQPATLAAPESGAPDSAPRAPVSLSLGGLAIGVLVFLWTYAVYRLGTLWHSNADYAYGWFVPLLCLALFWDRWKRRPAPAPVQAASGPVILWGLLALSLLPSALFLEVIPYWRFAGWMFAGAVIGITFCALYLIGGRSWVHHFAFPLLFFLIAVPWPTRIEEPLITKLSHLNAALSTWAVNWLGTPAVRRGVVIQTGAGMVGVDEACSGIRSFQAAVMIALFLGELFRYGLFRRIFFLLSGVGLAFVCNVVRTTYLVRVCDLKGKEAVNLYHDPAGFTILGITLAGLLLLIWLFRPKKRPPAELLDSTSATESAAELEVRTRWSGIEPPEPTPAGPPDGTQEPAVGAQHAHAALTAALIASGLWILAIEVQIEVWFRPAEARVAAVGNWSLQLPSQGLEYREPQIRDAVRTMLKYDEGKQVEWRESNGRPWQVYYMRWLPAKTRYQAIEAVLQAKGHGPDICLPLSGMALQKKFDSELRHVNGVTLLANVEKFSDAGRPLYVLSCYWEPDPTALQYQPARPPSTANAMRNAWHALVAHDRTRSEKRVLKVGVWGMETDEEAESAFRALLQRAVQPTNPGAPSTDRS